MTISVVIAVVDAFMYVVLSKKKKKGLAVWGISWCHRIYNVISEVLHKPRS